VQSKPELHLSLDGAKNAECVGDMETGTTVTVAIKGKLVRKSVTESTKKPSDGYDPTYGSIDLQDYEIKILTNNVFSKLADDNDGDE